MSSPRGVRVPLAARLRTALVAAAVAACTVASGTLGAGPSGPSGALGSDVQGVLRSDVRGVALPGAGSPVVLPTGKVAGSGVTRPVRGVGATGGEDVDSIPPTALLAYQRADNVLAQAAPDCGVTWTLLAAVGRVESDHGRHGRAVLDEDGVSRPAIVGAALDGTAGTSVVRDSDAGVIDGDAAWDRGVGAMQLLPSTWNVVAVDGDADGERSPDDIDDAALAAAVFLCSARSGLDSPDDVRAALLRYNRSPDYVSLVMSYARSYAASAPAGTYASYAGVPAPFEPPAQVELRAGDAPGAPGVKPDRDGSADDSDGGPRSEAGAAQPGPAEGSATADASPTSEPSTSPSTSASATPDAQQTTPGAASTPSAGPASETTTPTPQAETPASQSPSPAPEATTPAPGTGSPEPSTTPSPTPAPEPPPSPQVVEGLWTACGPGRCLDGQPLVLGTPDPACEIHDYDGDGVDEPTAVELDGLGGRTVALTVLADPAGWLVLQIRGLRWVSSTAPHPTGSGCGP